MNDLNELLTPAVLRAVAPEGESVNDFLTRITLDVTGKLVTRVLSEQKLSDKTLLDAAPLLGGPGQVANTVNPLGRFVGYRLNLREYSGVTVTIPRIGLQFDTALPEPLSIYVYSSGQDEPVRVVEVPYTRAKWVEWVDVDTELNISFAAGVDTAYIGYYEDDLPAGTHAIRRDFTGGSCGCPNDPFTRWNNYAWPKAVSVPAAALNEARTAFFPDDVTLEAHSFGLNLELTAYCDITRVLSSPVNETKLAEALQYALAIRVLAGLVSSPAVTQYQMRPDIQADALALVYHYEAKLYGGKEQGTDNYYPSLLGKIQFDLGELDTACKEPVRDRVMGTTLR